MKLPEGYNILTSYSRYGYALVWNQRSQWGYLGLVRIHVIELIKDTAVGQGSTMSLKFAVNDWE